MTYRVPTSRRQKKKAEGINLIPILDAVFIFIFFLLMSAQFLKIYEINSDVPIISNSAPPKSKKKPLALTVSIKKRGFYISTGIPAKVIKVIKKDRDGEFNFVQLHDFMVALKQKNVNEQTAVIEPIIDLTYEEIVRIMDEIRTLKKTDGAIYTKDKDGIDVPVKSLFSKIVFGNLMS